MKLSLTQLLVACMVMAMAVVGQAEEVPDMLTLSRRQSTGSAPGSYGGPFIPIDYAVSNPNIPAPSPSPASSNSAPGSYGGPFIPIDYVAVPATTTNTALVAVGASVGAGVLIVGVAIAAGVNIRRRAQRIASPNEAVTLMENTETV